MGTIKRGVGYCTNEECGEYAKGVFLLNHSENFHCPVCRCEGLIAIEHGFHTGTSNVFKEVRVEYNYDPINQAYREIAIVRDESLWGTHNTYTLQSALIKTEKRALKVAEAILANLNQMPGLLSEEDCLPSQRETVLSFDLSRESFAHRCADLAARLRESNLVIQQHQVER